MIFCLAYVLSFFLVLSDRINKNINSFVLFPQLIHLPPRPCITFMPRPMFIPRPRPRPPPGGGVEPSSLPAAAAWCCSLLGFLMVRSTERIVTAASVAAVSTLMRTISGSQTKAAYISSTLPLRTSTPYQRPAGPSTLWRWRNLLRTSVESMPELSARVLGIVSRALA